MPLVTALVGVGLAMSLVFAATSVVELSSTAPLLAVMIGIAVGIDYALFVLARHREQLADGLDPEESTGRAVATAGSAVVFAGLTVMIALAGLSVARIPFLTVMGITAALAVAVAVVVALTLLPAIMGAFGPRLAPRVRPARPGRRDRARAGSAATRWVRLVTARPLVTVVVVTAALLTAAVPALDLRLALPDAGTGRGGHPVARHLRPAERGVRARVQRPARGHRRHRGQHRPAGPGRRRPRATSRPCPGWPRSRSPPPTRAPTR